jgi:hypothetical protein
VINLPTWRFEHDKNEQWRWKRMQGGEVKVESSQSFPDRISCVMNAVGYALSLRRK